MTFLEHCIRDARHATRTILRMPVLSAVVILSFAVGIGVNVVVFSWLQAVVLKPLPGVADARAYQFVEPRAETGTFPGASWLEYRDLAERLRSFRELLAFRMVPFNVGEAARTERTYGLLVSGNYFSALGLRPALGRFFAPGEADRAGTEPVVEISYGYWQAHFKRDRRRRPPDDSRQRSRSRRSRRRPAGIPGDDPRARLLALGASDDGAGASRRLT
jgi:hypothetical protein